MTDDAIYEYTAIPGRRTPDGVPPRNLTARDLERMPPHHRREVLALVKNGLFFTPVNKSTATKAMNKARDADIRAVEQAAEGSDE
jgi:hypothetical protein